MQKTPKNSTGHSIPLKTMLNYINCLNLNVYRLFRAFLVNNTKITKAISKYRKTIIFG